MLKSTVISKETRPLRICFMSTMDTSPAPDQSASARAPVERARECHKNHVIGKDGSYFGIEKEASSRRTLLSVYKIFNPLLVQSLS